MLPVAKSLAVLGGALIGFVSCIAQLHAGETGGIVDWARSVPPAAPGENVAIYFSNGDNEIMFTSPPVDSPQAIDEMLDVLQKAYGLKRIYWRAPQIEQIIYESEIRKDAVIDARWARWMDHLFADLGTGNHMMKAAHERGLAVWGVAALFDHGSQPETEGTKVTGPFSFESFIRIKHPEYVPVDRRGILRMPGPISFAYPEARKELVDTYVRLMRDRGYEGLTFQMYVENMALRNDDEFGFNEPVVEAYRQRYGVDIRNEPYDSQKLAQLRGEYLTQFFRELRAATRPLGLKIGVTLGAKYPDEPQRWLATPDVRVSGRIVVDWRTYAQEDLVDEFFVYVHGDPLPTLRKLRAELKPTISLATLNSYGFDDENRDLLKAGTWRVMAGSYEEVEYGYHLPQPVEAMEGNDFIAKLSVLSQMGAGTTAVDLQRVLKATEDPSVLVRRRALRLLVTALRADPALNTPEVTDAIKRRLDDPENIVRCTAVSTLGYVGRSEDMPALFDAVAKHINPMMLLFPATMPLAELSAERRGDLRLGLEHAGVGPRIVTLAVLRGIGLQPDLLPLIIASTHHDDWTVRYFSAQVLERYPAAETTQRLMEMLDDSSATVRCMAAYSLSRQQATESESLTEEQAGVVQKLKEMFALYGDGDDRADAAWAWRPIGEALVRMGPVGIRTVESFMNQKEDRSLAEHAWHVLYVQQDPYQHVIKTTDELEAGYRKYPSLFGPK